MSMTALLAADLLAKVRTITALENRTSLSIGGRSEDPGLVKIPLPAAWVTNKSTEPDERDYSHGPTSGFIGADISMATWCVTTFIQYTDDADLINVQFPMLDAIVAAVHGTDGPDGSMQWRDAGRRIALVYPDRMAYEQRFTITLIPQ